MQWTWCRLVGRQPRCPEQVHRESKTFWAETCEFILSLSLCRIHRASAFGPDDTELLSDPVFVAKVRSRRFCWSLCWISYCWSKRCCNISDNDATTLSPVSLRSCWKEASSRLISWCTVLATVCSTLEREDCILLSVDSSERITLLGSPAISALMSLVASLWDDY